MLGYELDPRKRAEMTEVMWRAAVRDGRAHDAYAELLDYRRIIKEQENEQIGLWLDSDEYFRKGELIADLRNRESEMRHETVNKFLAQDEWVYKKLDNDNYFTHLGMSEAADKGGIGKYDAFREKLEVNMSEQERLSFGLNSFSFDLNYCDTLHDWMTKEHYLDCKMRDKAGERISAARARGIEPNQQDVEAFERYKGFVRDDEKRLHEHREQMSWDRDQEKKNKLSPNWSRQDGLGPERDRDDGLSR